MNGKFFLDTNAIIQLLKGNQELLEILQNAEFIACSIISKLEYMSFQDISENDAPQPMPEDCLLTGPLN